MAGMIEKWIGARVLDLGHYVVGYFVRNTTVSIVIINGTLNATPVVHTPLHTSSLSILELKIIYIESRVQSRVQSSPESSFCIDPP